MKRCPKTGKIIGALDPIEHVSITKGMTVNELMVAMGNAGVMGGGKLAKAADILANMIKDPDCTVFFGQAGAMVPGGQRKIIHDMLRSGAVDVFVCTGATLTHDTVEALGHRHYIGHHQMDDNDLNKEGLDRMYDSIMSNDVYQDLEKFIGEHFDTFKDIKSIKDLLWKIGSLLENECILKICHEKQIPIFCPALSDSGLGLMIWGQLSKGKEIATSAFEDMKQIMDIAWDTKQAGVLYVGGGVPKNYIQQAMQLCPDMASYGVQITMDRPEPGGSSGAELKEGVSWGKMHADGQYVDVICDATIALPILWAAVKERL